MILLGDASNFRSWGQRKEVNDYASGKDFRTLTLSSYLIIFASRT